MARTNDPGHRPGCKGARFRDIAPGQVLGQRRRRRSCDNCGVIHWWDPARGAAGLAQGRWRKAW